VAVLALALTAWDYLIAPGMQAIDRRAPFRGSPLALGQRQTASRGRIHGTGYAVLTRARFCLSRPDDSAARALRFPIGPSASISIAAVAISGNGGWTREAVMSSNQFFHILLQRRW